MKRVVTVEDAIIFAADLHRGHKAGEPYILHPLRVALRVRTERRRLAAVLHDVVEDTGVTLDRSEWMGVARTPGWVRRGTVSRQRRTRPPRPDSPLATT